jgi:dihydroorotate dehydrogenase
MCGEDAADKITLGADLVQIYTGFIYEGPDIVAESAAATRALKQSR